MTVTVTYRLWAPGLDAVQLRFPVLWGPERGAPIPMRRRGNVFVARVELPRGALVRHSYSAPDLPDGEQFEPGLEVNRYVVVTGETIIEDAVYAFAPESIARPESLQGRVISSGRGAPPLEVIVVADGILTTTADGYFHLPVRDRPQLVTFFQADGSHHATTRLLEPGEHRIELEAAAPARVRIEAFATPPAHHELRVFATVAQIASQHLFANRLTAEVHRTVVDGALELDLHDAQWVDYLYSVGNAVLSQEREAGQSVVRGFEARDGLVVRDQVGEFLSDETTWLEVAVPENTGPDDVVSLRGLDPRLLMMHPAGPSTWTLALSHRDWAGQSYNYVKTWLGVGDELAAPRTITGPEMRDVVREWRLHASDPPAPPPEVPIILNPFRVVVTLPDWYGHEHAHALEPWLTRIAEQGFHGVVLNEVWCYAGLEPSPIIARSGRDFSLYMPAFEAARATRIAHGLGLTVELEQQLVGAEAYLRERAIFPDDWWRAWLEQNERFNLENARVAQAAGIDCLRLAGAQPGLEYETAFAFEYNAGMAEIIAAVRAVYDGVIVVPTEIHRVGPLDYWKHGDRLTEITPRLEMPEDASQEQVDRWVANTLDRSLKTQSTAVGLPISIKFGVQSTGGALAGRIVPEGHDSYAATLEDRAPLGLEDQRKVYEACFKAANARPWIEEIDVWVFGPTDAPESRDVDVRGKPAGALAAAWARAITDCGSG